ncbi:MAG TPA: response regulator transcription factor [Candidatus Eubacterium faecale]|uniref:Stage 0 sporulation protein A homolog n=1 Tax=Candidatus Eubacterium faecale TaxID=2838568 RepID=A0A9D2S8X0_9FIRM|nr:response regulator transcription factor [Candidatus Eubacterium faecale]
MYKILIIEDDERIARAIKKEAESWGFAAKTADNFSNILGEFSEYAPQLVLLDISLPFYNGYYWCEKIRAVSSVPILFISSAADNMNMVMAMNMGADDFIAKPFDLHVLIAKMNALLRRAYDFAPASPILEHRGALLDTGRGVLEYNGKTVELSKNEYRILLELMRNKGKAVSREKLMQSLWQTDSFIDDNTLTVNINRLRKKLDGAGLQNFIKTKFSVGYIVE